MPIYSYRVLVCGNSYSSGAINVTNINYDKDRVIDLYIGCGNGYGSGRGTNRSYTWGGSNNGGDSTGRGNGSGVLPQEKSNNYTRYCKIIPLEVVISSIHD